jgi:serine/threonine-protein kinase
VALDPRFAVAYARLAEAHAAMYWFYYDRTDARLELARQAAEQAVRLAPDRAEPHIALGYYYYWGHLDYPRALEHFRAARARHPNNSDLLAAIAYVEQRQGRWDDAIAKLKEAIALDPRSNVKTYQLAYAYLYVRRFDRAEEYLDRAIGLAPYWPVPYGYKALLRVVRDGDLRQARGVVHDAVARLGAGKVVPAFVVSSRVSASVITADPAFAPMIDGLSALSFDGDSVRYYLLKAEAFAFRQRRQAARVYADSARVVLEARLRAQPDDFGFRAMLGLAYAYLGRSADATREGRRATELLPVARDANLGPFMAINLARIYTMIGQPDAAVSQLEPLLSVPSWISVPELAADPVWEPLRDHPRFQRLVSRSR